MRADEFPINILLIGPTQAGKSTFYNLLRSLDHSQTSDDNSREGDGQTSCTKKCKSTVLSLPLTRYKLVRAESGEDLGTSQLHEMDLLDRFHRTPEGRSMSVVPIHPNGPKINVRVIDTPGLDDSHGDDFSNLAEVVRTLNEMSKDAREAEAAQQVTETAEETEARHKRRRWKTVQPGQAYINALVFIVSSQSAFSDSFQKAYQFYEKTMPNLFGGLAVVNTNFTVSEWTRRAKSYFGGSTMAGAFPESSRYRFKKERSTAFKQLLGREPSMFFIDSKPSQRYPFEVWASRTALAELLLHIASQTPLPIAQMKLHKSPDMSAVDASLATILQLAKEQFEAQEKDLLAESSRLKNQIQSAEKTVSSTKQMLEAAQRELETYNNDTEFPINTYRTEDNYYLIGRLARAVSLYKTTGELKIEEPDHPGFLVRQINTDTARWTRSRKEGGTWIGDYEGNRGTIPLLSARSYTINRRFYASTIRRLEETIYQLKSQLEIAELHVADLKEGDNEEEDPMLKEIAHIISQCGVVRSRLLRDWVDIEEEFDEAAKARYSRFKQEGVNVGTLISMIRPFDALVANRVEAALLRARTSL